MTQILPQAWREVIKKILYTVFCFWCLLLPLPKKNNIYIYIYIYIYIFIYIYIDACLFQQLVFCFRDVPKVSCCPLQERWLMGLGPVGGPAKEFICHLSLCVRAHRPRWSSSTSLFFCFFFCLFLSIPQTYEHICYMILHNHDNVVLSLFGMCLIRYSLFTYHLLYWMLTVGSQKVTQNQPKSKTIA